MCKVNLSLLNVIVPADINPSGHKISIPNHAGDGIVSVITKAEPVAPYAWRLVECEPIPMGE